MISDTLNHPAGGSSRNLRYHPEVSANLSYVESGSEQGYSAFDSITANTQLFAVIVVPRTANGVKTLTSIRVYAGAATSGVASVYIYECGGDPDSAIPTGNWSTKAGAKDEAIDVAITTSVKNTVTFAGNDYAPLADTAIAFLFTLGALGTSFRLNGNAGQSTDGWRALYTATITNEVQDIVWLNWEEVSPLIELVYSDGSIESNMVGAGASSVTDSIKLGGADAFAGVAFQPDEDWPLAKIQCFFDQQGTAASAGSVKVICVNEALETLFSSVNSYPATSMTTGARYSKTFWFENYVIPRGTKVYFLATQVAGLGDGTNYIRLAGSQDGLYDTNGSPPTTWGQNINHGLRSVSTTTGIANLAHSTTLGYFMRIFRKPLTRNSQTF